MLSKTSPKVAEYMTKKLYQIAPSASLKEALSVLDEQEISSLAVIEGDKLVGVIARTDLLRETLQNNGQLPEKKVSEVMTSPAMTISPDASIFEAATLMLKKKIHRLYVVQSERTTGVISTKDLMRVIQKEQISVPISLYMSSPVISIDIKETVATANRMLLESNVHGLAVTEDDWPVGIYTQFEALQSKNLPPDTKIEQAMSYALFCMSQNTPLYRAAAYKLGMGIRRILAVEHRKAVGVLTDFDLCKVLTME